MRKIKTDNINFFYSPAEREKNLNLHETILENYKKIYTVIYSELIEKTEVVYNRFVEERMEDLKNNKTGLFINPEDFEDEAIEYALKKLENEKLMYYYFVLTSLSNLYQIFEQNLRRWLYGGMKEFNIDEDKLNEAFDYNKDSNEYSKFYVNFGALEKILRKLELTVTNHTVWVDVDNSMGMYSPIEFKESIVNSKYWEIIRECSLLSNAFKHGSGRSANELMEIRPEYFVKSNLGVLMEVNLTTNLEIVFCIEEIDYYYYHSAFTEFWEKISILQFNRQA